MTRTFLATASVAQEKLPDEQFMIHSIHDITSPLIIQGHRTVASRTEIKGDHWRYARFRGFILGNRYPEQS